MSQNGTLYPVIKSESEVNIMIDKKLNESRISEMNNQKAILEKDLKRYRKLGKRWKNVNKGFIIGGVIITGLTGVGAAITGAVVPPILLVSILMPAIPIVLASLGIVETITFTAIEVGVFKNKIDFYDEKCKMIRSYVDKLYYYIEKARSDNIISIDELQGFRNIMDDYRKRVEQIEEKDIDPRIFKIDLDKMRKEANKETRKLLNNEIKENIKEDLKSQFNVFPQVKKILET